MVVAARNTASTTFPATPESVAYARRWATGFAAEADADAHTVEAVRLAISEAVTNVVMHAYGHEQAEGEVQMTIAVAEDELWLLVADDGRGHQAVPESPGLGWGLALIADAADGLVVAERSGGGTELRIRFSLRPPRRVRDARRAPDSARSRRN